MIRRAVVLISLLLAGTPASAVAATELNVIPYGQQEPGVAWASAPGMLPASAQALMYDRLTPLGRNVTDATLQPSADGSGYFKSTRLLAPDDPSLITDETISSGALTARIRRATTASRPPSSCRARRRSGSCSASSSTARRRSSAAR